MASSGSSTNDDAVLQVIFDPEAPTGSEEVGMRHSCTCIMYNASAAFGRACFAAH